MATDERKPQHGSGVPVEELVGDAQNLSAEEFEQRHGSGFLLLTAAGMKGDLGATSTEVNLFGDEEDGGRTAGVEVLAFPIRRRDRSASHLVTVGRISQNDMVIPDISVSRVHAYFKQRPDGVFVVQDTASTNGSTVNGRTVPTKEAGEPTPLSTGDNVRLGQMDLTFLTAAALREFALKFGD